MKTKVVNIRRLSEGEPYTYCGRGKGGTVPKKVGVTGWLGNPVRLHKPCPECGHTHKQGGDALKCYRRYLWRRLKELEFSVKVRDLKGNLGCFCHPRPCHVEVLIAAIYWLNTDAGHRHVGGLREVGVKTVRSWKETRRHREEQEISDEIECFNCGQLIRQQAEGNLCDKCRELEIRDLKG